MLQNAIQFAESNGTITIQSTHREDQNTEISITNSGPPLSQETIENILKPFTLNEDSMNHSKGLGLGLSLCQSLLKCHGSKLQIISQNNTIKVSFTLKNEIQSTE